MPRSIQCRLTPRFKRGGEHSMRVMPPPDPPAVACNRLLGADQATRFHQNDPLRVSISYREMNVSGPNLTSSANCISFSAAFSSADRNATKS